MLQVTVPLPGEVVVEDGRPKALQVETAAIKAKNRTLETLLSNKFFKNAIDGMKSGWVFGTQDTNQFPHFSEDVQSLPSRIRELIDYALQGGRKRSVSSVSSERVSSEEDRTRKLDLATIEGWHVHTECVHIAFADSYTHEATLYTTTFVNDFPVHLWLFPPRPDMDTTITSSTTSTPSHSHSPQLHRSNPMFSFIAHAPDVISAELNRAQLLFLMRLKDSVTMFKSSLMDFLDTSTFIPPKRPSSTSQEESEESFRSPSSPSDLANSDEEAPKSISGCVIVEHVEANILLPSIFTTSKSSTGTENQTSNSLPTTQEVRENIEEVIRGFPPLSLNTETLTEPNVTVSSVSPSSSQTSLTSSHLAQSVLTTSQSSLQPSSSTDQTSSTSSFRMQGPPTPDQTSLTSSPSNQTNLASSQSSVQYIVNSETVSVVSLPIISEAGSNSNTHRMYSSTSNIAAVQPSPMITTKSLSTSNIVTEEQRSAVVTDPLPDRTVSTPATSHLTVGTTTTDTPSNASSACSSTEDVRLSSRNSPCSLDEFVMVEDPVPRTQNTGIETSLQSSAEVKVQVSPPPDEQPEASVRRKRRVRSPPPLSARKVRSPSPVRTEPQYILCIKVDGIHALPNIFTSGAISARCNANSINIREVNKEMYEQMKEEGRFKRTPQTEGRPEPCLHPVVKARIEVGDQVSRFFPVSVTEADAILVAKATGLEIGLLVQNMAVLKDFFDDEFETELPIPMHLRVDNTKLVILESPGDGPDHWKSLSVEVNQADIHRGRSLAEGVNIFMDGGQGSEVQTGQSSVAADEQENRCVFANTLSYMYSY